jgi:aryl-alcohol dehydrogenase-like predicted oxidoreductase
MQTRPLGQSGIQASVVGFGAWAIGGWMWGGADERAAIAAIHRAIDLGMNLIDTAPMYNYGYSEELIGRAIKDRRDKVVLATKCGLIWYREEGQFFFHADERGITPGPSRYKVYRCLKPHSIREEIEQSLRRLQTDYIDLYQTHWPDGSTPVEETMACLLKLKEEGKIRAIGTSNITVELLEGYRRLGPVDSTQEKFSMLDPDIVEAGLAEYCRGNGIAILAYSPLAQGLLTGKVPPDRQFAEGDQRRTKPRFSRENRLKVQALLEELKPFAERYHLTLTQLVIAWTVAQPGITHALCGARTPEQVEENARGGEVTLQPADLAAMNEIVAKHRPGIR